MEMIKEGIFATLTVVLILITIQLAITYMDYLETAMLNEEAQTRYYNDLALVCSQYKAAEANR